MIDRAKGYINDIRTGKIPACKWIRLAMDRHVNDLKRKNWDYHFDEDEAERVLSLYEMFKFSKGKVSGQPFDIMPWFAALVYMSYGWRRNDGGKRFRKVYCKVGRGNAKTANLVTIGTIGFLFDNASDPEVYWVATKKDQAKIGWDRQRKMLEMLVADFPELAPMLNIPKGHTSTRVSRTDALSWVSYLGRDSQSEDGASPSTALIDEFHAWDNTDLLDVLESGMVKVEDPMTWIITTAGYKPQGPNSEFLQACKNMLSGVGDNPELLAFIYELDEADDWRDKTTWIKPNPGLGISVTMTGLETEYNKIETQGQQKEIDFKVKNLNIEYASQDGWIPDDVWQKGNDVMALEDLMERECWGGLDLANTNDFSAFCLFFPPRYEGDAAFVYFRFWIPENAIEKHRTKRPFIGQWIMDGYITETPGNVTDYDIIAAGILEMVEGFNIVSVGYDSALSSYLTPRLLDAGLNMEPYSQAPMWLTVPAKRIEHLCEYQYKDGETVIWENALKHGGNPVIRWMMANVTMKVTDSGNYHPSKGRSAEKIDGVMSMINAVGQWLKDRSEPVGKSYLFEKETDLIFL